MAEMVNFDLVLKRFFDSLLGWLRARNPRDVTEQYNIANAISRMELIASDPQKYTRWNELYGNFGDMVGLCVCRVKEGEYDKRVYIAVTSVLNNLYEYYKTPDNEFFMQKVEQSLKDYFVVMSPNVFQKISYKMMSPTAFMQKLSNQKTK